MIKKQTKETVDEVMLSENKSASTNKEGVTDDHVNSQYSQLTKLLCGATVINTFTFTSLALLN